MPKKTQAEDHLKELRSRIAKAPVDPGVYRWIDSNGDVLYVGKAKNLKNRLKSYVQKSPDRSLGPWKLALLEKITDVDWTMTETELEALILEANLIKELKPKYNVLMKDDKNYVYVRISVKDPYPTVSVIRRIEDDGAKYFGPFLSAHHIHRTLDMLHDVYGWRACQRSTDYLSKVFSSSEGARATESRSCAIRELLDSPLRSSLEENGNASLKENKLKPCLDFQIGKCNGLCAGKITQEEYRRRIEAMMRFFKGDRSDVIVKLKEKMQRAAEKKLFEDAAKLRDTLNYIESLDEQQIVADTTGANADIFGVALLSGHSHVVVLREREGKLIGERSFALAGHADSHGEVLAQFLPQYYIALEDIPDTVIFSEAPEEIDILANWLSHEKGRKVVIHVPERGKKSKLLTMAERNAQEKIKQQLAKWEAATEKVENALEELRDTLQLREKPHRIECYDISHLGGTETVGSMVVFVDGKAKNSDYRSFTLRTIHKGEIDDYKSLREVLIRRLRYLVKDVHKEEKEWKKSGITFGKYRKGDLFDLQKMYPERFADAVSNDADKFQYLVARKGDEVITAASFQLHEKGIIELFPPTVSEEFQGKNLHQFLFCKLLRSFKKGKVYMTMSALLEEGFSMLGFRYVHSAPSFLQEKIDWLSTSHPSFSPESFIVMMYDVRQNKLDPSFTSTPDLLVLDGGKGQLSVGRELLKNMELSIPLISLAKREEEVFTPGDPNPVAFPEDSEARFLLMRLRDEAHRFANRHREKRLSRSLRETA